MTNTPIRIAADTQLAKGTYYIKAVILDHSEATSAIFYNEADNSTTAGADLLTIHNSSSELTKMLVFPGKRGIRFNTGVYIDYNAGTIYVIPG